MKAYIFPGQGSQFPGMGAGLYEAHAAAKEIFEQANDILGFRITEVMFNGSEEDLKKTNITQPAYFSSFGSHCQIAGRCFSARYGSRAFGWASFRLW